MIKKYRFLFVTLLLISCGLQQTTKNQEVISPFADEGTDAVVAAGLAAMTGVVQFENESGVPILNAASNTCGKPVTMQPCQSGSRSIVYANCETEKDGTYSGSVQILYSDLGCSINASGATATRTLTLDRSGFLNSLITTRTLPHNDFRNQQIGEGTRYTRINEGYLIDINGIRKIRTESSGSKIYDISIRTKSPLILTGDLKDPERILNGGTIEVIHNSKRFVSTITPFGLKYSQGDCCHPTSGELKIEYLKQSDNTSESTAQVKFTSTCGEVLFTKNAITVPLKIHGCE